MDQHSSAREVKLSETITLGTSALLQAQEMAGERLANYVRLGYALFGTLSIISVAQTQTRTATTIWSVLTAAFVAWGVAVRFLLRDRSRYRPALPYLSVILDTTLLHGCLAASFFNHSHHYEVFRSPTLWLWIAVSNGITGLRYRWVASVLAGCLTLAYGSSVIGYAHLVMKVPWITEARYLGGGLFPGDCFLNVLGCALPAFFAAVGAWRAKHLVHRAVEEAALRSGMGHDLRHTQQALKAKVKELETRSQEVHLLNEELRRQIEQRSRELLAGLLPGGGKSFAALGRLGSGALLGDYYRVIRALGEGGMGVVYEVERTTDHRHFAAKALTKQPDRTAVARFAREAQILARLHHPNLISIFDVDITKDGGLYIVMELVDGTSLWQLRTQFGTTNASWGISILRQIADALAVLHGQGIVHRDLKPENVLVAHSPVGATPVVKLADFGISVLLNERAAPVSGQPILKAPLSATAETIDVQGQPVRVSSQPQVGVVAVAVDGATAVPAFTPKAGRGPTGPELTSTGAIVGTPLYMAPELLSGSRNAQPSADVFSLGVMAFEVLTGKMPFERSAILATALGEDLKIPSLRDHRPELHSALAATLEQCLLADPSRRPQALHVSTLLAQWQETGSNSEERRLRIKPF